jgi:hypothetical protein
MDSKGKATAVQIPLREWVALQKALEKGKKKQEFLEGLEEAAKEIKQIEAGKKKAKTLEELLDEL